MTHYEINGHRISGDCIDVSQFVEPGTYNPHRVRPWIMGNAYGALAVVWASCEQDAFDEACDCGLLAGLAIDADYFAEMARDWCHDNHPDAAPDDDHECCPELDSVMFLGNASEPHDSVYAWIAEAELSPDLLALASACHAAGIDTLANVWTGPPVWTQRAA